ncbi:MAG: metallophosphoesterase [Paracoccus sp. (in: a-proteobacteria)]|nr:metallophosphoesterase [Paracoccus sp. (in: a-proteobacteria)]
MLTRRRFLRGLSGETLAGLFVAGYALAAEPGFSLRARHSRIAMLADLHLGWPWVGLCRLRRIVDRTNALGADLIALLGDYVAGHPFVRRPVRIADAASVMAGLSAPLGSYAILGNHDWWDDRAAQRRGGGPNLYAAALESNGIPVLSNRAIRLPDFWLAGLDRHFDSASAFRRAA